MYSLILSSVSSLEVKSTNENDYYLVYSSVALLFNYLLYFVQTFYQSTKCGIEKNVSKHIGWFCLYFYKEIWLHLAISHQFCQGNSMQLTGFICIYITANSTNGCWRHKNNYLFNNYRLDIVQLQIIIKLMTISIHDIIPNVMIDWKPPQKSYLVFLLRLNVDEAYESRNHYWLSSVIDIGNATDIDKLLGTTKPCVWN